MLKIYNADFSPNATRTRGVAYELELDFEMVEVDLRSGGNKTPEYLALNPNGKVPVMDHDGFVLWESRAINAYLASLKPEKGLCPTDTKTRGVIDQWSYWQAIHLGPTMQRISFERLLKKAFGMGEPDESAIESQLKELPSLLAVLNGGLEGKDFITGDLTIADYALISTFVTHEKAGMPVADYPDISAWVERMNARPAWQKATAPVLAMFAG